MTGNGSHPVLEVSHLQTSFFTKAGEVKAVDDVSLKFTQAGSLVWSESQVPARP